LTRNLPAPLHDRHSPNGGDFQERELLYKLLFDMKADLNDLKSLFYELVKSNNLRMPDLNSVRQLQSAYPTQSYRDESINQNDSGYFTPTEAGRVTPIIIDQGKPQAGFDKSEVEDAPLAMDEIEKEAIKRALKKYNGRRKEAAEELKISERTLYRKIKQYNLG
jgi:transcriptional regulator of acetoin/glycerol metabolism